ncbi:hypothetical protein DSL92_05540 [Billgrantia gudaonensis]|uniref:Uncharacterized protein n=1 Tax=Billgrantia gudaonensis TaxID=376427 RepID=A0A3S0NE26_9GAMM|nr:hypothetical protein DSL92_05540 [Halomonas gudaonensis]
MPDARWTMDESSVTKALPLPPVPPSPDGTGITAESSSQPARPVRDAQDPHCHQTRPRSMRAPPVAVIELLPSGTPIITDHHQVDPQGDSRSDRFPLVDIFHPRHRLMNWHAFQLPARDAPTPLTR